MIKHHYNYGQYAYNPTTPISQPTVEEVPAVEITMTLDDLERLVRDYHQIIDGYEMRNRYPNLDKLYNDYLLMLELYR